MKTFWGYETDPILALFNNCSSSKITDNSDNKISFNAEIEKQDNNNNDDITINISFNNKSE